MRKMIMLAVFAAAFSVTAGVPDAFSADDPGETISRFCAEHGDLGLSHGACVTFFTNHNIVPHDATVCKDPATQARVGAKNRGQCVKALKDLKNDD